jgi:hypothetical protein
MPSPERGPAVTDSADRTLGLTDRADFTLDHCATPMRFLGSSTRWLGKPGQGSETNTCRYCCDGCAATLELVLTEPDRVATT